MRKFFKRTAVISLSVVLAVSLAACKKSDNKEEDTGSSKEVIEFWGVNDPQISAQQIIADEKGYFKEEGLNVEIKFLQTGTDMNSMMAGGTAKICCEVQGLSTQLKANGVNATILAPVANAGGTQCVVAGPDFKVESAENLEGCTIGMANGAGVNMAVMSMCDALNVDYSSIKWVYCDPSEQLAALMKGDIDVMACWEPYCSNAVKQGGTLLFNGIYSYIPGAEGDVSWMAFYATLQGNDDFISSHKEDVSKIIKAMKKATDYINDNRDEAVEIIADRIGAEKEQVKLIMSENTYSMKWDEAFQNGISAYAEYMLKMNNIEAVPDIAGYTDSSYLSGVDASLVDVAK